MSGFGGILGSANFAKYIFAAVFAASLMGTTSALAQRSDRVLRDLAVQRSEDLSAQRAEPKTVKTEDLPKDVKVPEGTALPIGWMASTGHPTTGTTASTGATAPAASGDNGQGMQAIQGILGALTGQGSGSGAKTNTGTTAPAANGGSSTSGNSGGTSNGQTAGQNASQEGSGSRRSDQVDPNRPLPTDTNVEGRDCSATRKTWQPFTKHKFRLTSCFGHRRSTHSHHNGIDAVVMGQPPTINPVAPGKIARAGMRAGYGCEIIIEHDSCPAGIGGTRCYSQYAHLKKDRNGRCPAAGRTGETVNPCTELAIMGNTGASQAPHLHFEVRTSLESTSAQDPNKVFREWQAHRNYQREGSTCGTVGNGQAPARQAPASTGTQGQQ